MLEERRLTKRLAKALDVPVWLMRKSSPFLWLWFRGGCLRGF